MGHGNGQSRSAPSGQESSSGVIVDPDPATRYVGLSLNAKGNELAFRRREPGRVFRKLQGMFRPAGMSTARFSTGVNPEDPITDGPYWPRA